ncbi:hypothetical protein TrST_g3642 [Triparma strigata]|uniref:Uncharacterized protein n=1 Tax=Triparma strigata TaxID=1606541 RepID=A0A9W7BMC4_9STRA|nr:hypothetical protein TrST_g3642 [Triparma strigata]
MNSLPTPSESNKHKKDNSVGIDVEDSDDLPVEFQNVPADSPLPPLPNTPDTPHSIYTHRGRTLRALASLFLTVAFVAFLNLEAMEIIQDQPPFFTTALYFMFCVVVFKISVIHEQAKPSVLRRMLPLAMLTGTILFAVVCTFDPSSTISDVMAGPNTTEYVTQLVGTLLPLPSPPTLSGNCSWYNTSTFLLSDVEPTSKTFSTDLFHLGKGACSSANVPALLYLLDTVVGMTSDVDFSSVPEAARIVNESTTTMFTMGAYSLEDLSSPLSPLDTLGTFLYAYNLGAGFSDPNITIDHVTFSPVPERLLNNSVKNAGWTCNNDDFDVFASGATSPADPDSPVALLSQLMHSVVFQDDPAHPLSISLPNLTIGKTYKVQMIFHEKAWERAFQLPSTESR